MIGRLQGKVWEERLDGTLIIDVHGVGYLVRASSQALALAHRSPADIALLIHTIVREDVLDLYGFASDDELSFFKLLLEVSGVGPKTALGILNLAGIEVLQSAIAAGDATYLTRVSGVGKKSAERIVVELKDKLAKAGLAQGHEARAGDADVLEALINLGYSREESREALKSISSDAVELSARVREALRILSKQE